MTGLPLVLPIGDTLYALERIYPEADEFKLCWTLVRAGSELRTVTVDADDQITCNCPDFVMRKQNRGDVCRHISNLMRVGLLPQPRTP